MKSVTVKIAIICVLVVSIPLVARFVLQPRIFTELNGLMLQGTETQVHLLVIEGKISKSDAESILEYGVMYAHQNSRIAYDLFWLSVFLFACFTYTQVDHLKNISPSLKSRTRWAMLLISVVLCGIFYHTPPKHLKKGFVYGNLKFRRCQRGECGHPKGECREWTSPKKIQHTKSERHIYKNAEEEKVCVARLKKWLQSFEVEVKLDDGISDWTFEYIDSQREELHALINEMGGVYENPEKRKSISSCNVAFFSKPMKKNNVSIPGVLLIENPSGATFFAIDSFGRIASGFIALGNNYCSGGGMYMTKLPGVAFSTNSKEKNGDYSRYLIYPSKDLEPLYGTIKPTKWAHVGIIKGNKGIFSRPIVSEKQGILFRLDDLDKNARRASAPPP